MRRRVPAGALAGRVTAHDMGSAQAVGVFTMDSTRQEFGVRRPLRRLALMLIIAAINPTPNAIAQSATAVGRFAPPAVWWVAGAVLAGTLAADAPLERASLANRSRLLDNAARVGDALGAGRNLVPAIATGYLAGRLLARPRLADAALHTAVAYALGNVVTSAGKPVIGRHRPDTTGSPWRFHPFTGKGSFHSWPSAHTLHAFTIAGAVAEDAGTGWATATAYGAAAVVGWSRVYADEHWASDVVSSAVLGAVIGHTTVRVWRARSKARRTSRERRSITMDVTPDGRAVAISVAW